MEVKPSKGLANAVVHSGFIVAGAVTIIVGPILPILIARWSMSDQRAGLFFTMQFCGNLLGIASLGSLISWRGYGPMFGIGFSFMSLGIAALNLNNEFIGLTATAVFGYGLGLILSGANLWVAEVAASRRAAALSVLNLAWGIGAVACPALVMLAQRSHRLGLLLLVISVLSALHALVLVSMDIEPGQQSDATSTPSRDKLPVGAKTAFVLGALFFLYCGSENAIGGWAAALTKRMGSNPGYFWELAPMFFWAGLLMGRALGPLVFRRVAEGAILVLGLMIAGACNGVLLWVSSLQSAAICLVAAGLGFACIYPLLVASLVGHYGRRARRAGSIIFALAGLGGATIPWLVGFTSTRSGSLRAGLVVPLIACLFMIGLLPFLNKQRPV